ncbi:hypothetical protein ATE69_18130 [Sphingopyxis sp. H071]|uniref:phage tail assembly chaperone n=1 Tax=unclassified Sphingopyxis TaxID=2614943 RepID=UPI0007314118|nr:hypothetical protein ATE61_16440 [Sphingopyxis sp. H057]KTE50264.1 hypothetical protein ATE64_17655 [Sphingopyxis sp. H073]KTE50650.1 hypothetical protein ATE69_18130 [Sphingopyxis sp. H071]KTE59939.1 hypothetical protein ATE66_10155 [Sphingopyxis sp. H107]KTE63719.1 hypothetical protein ATE65_14835 [Sphingopyxis sp. H100]KTE71811.1 hypothetical protein ATE60_13275 [Sphingopyxis sp. H081]KTE82570.1 hypothetical protein ATE63_00610 [Sphingopyxis sp. H067]
MTDERFAAAALPLLGLMARALGWRPDEFWSATPADIAAVLGSWREGDAAAPVDRMELAAMMEQFPDG